MNIYVDKMPGSCKTCDFQCYGQCLNGADILNCDYSTMKCHLKKNRPQDCPLKPISEYKPSKRFTDEELTALKAVLHGCNINTRLADKKCCLLDHDNKIIADIPYYKALEIISKLVEDES